jgi:hypothetical protein
VTELQIEERGGALRLRVHVKPRASRSRVIGVREGALDVAVAAPPVDGEANKELVSTLSRRLGVGRKAVDIVSGTTGRNKLVSVQGLRRAELLARLGVD